MARKVCILGMGPSAGERRVDIESHCEGFELWGLNNGYISYPQLQGKWNRFFELHSWDYLKTWKPNANTEIDHFRQLKALDCPVWVGNILPVIEKQKVYDFVKVFTHFKTNYFLGSPSLMLALALYEHDHGDEIEEVRSWGIDTSDPTHGQQRASWAYWMRAASDREIKLSGTSKEFMYEFERDDGLRGLREQVGMMMLEAAKEQEAIKCPTE